MQTTNKKSDKAAKPSNSKPKRVTKDDTAQKSQDEKLKKGPYTISTPRNFVQKSSTADIYGQKKMTAIHSAKAPKKLPITSNKTSNPSPMKDLLKSSPSSSSQISAREINSKMRANTKVDAKVTPYSATPRSRTTNVTVNSPVVKRKLNLDREKSFVIEVPRESTKEFGTQRQRTKTRTLDENEVKILTPDSVDNNAEMLNLTKKLTAKPKAFYIDLDGEQSNKPPTAEIKSAAKPPSDDEVSYEDDFESYESDFDSYHSSLPSNGSVDGEHCSEGDDDEAGLEAENPKENKDEEKMLDSGNFDLRDQRSAHKPKPAVMDYIVETSEDAGGDKRISLTDEGFQEMSSSSAVSSMRTLHVDVLDRPLFIDFNKSKENKRKKIICERLKQRAQDLLSIITLHEMSYNLFEMKPISYDLYMATFGRSNYTQISVQTFDDGVTEETQTEEVECEHKWTQHPVEFSKNDICIRSHRESRKYSKNTEDYLTKFTFLTQQSSDGEIIKIVNQDENYKFNQLRIYLEQKDGVGPNKMLPYETYKTKLVENKYNTHRLGRFLKRMECRISQILNSNKGNSDLIGLNVSKYPFSKGYVSISTKNIVDTRLAFIKDCKITQMCYSDSKSNLLMTIHENDEKNISKYCAICLWDISVAREPIKILRAIDKVVIGRFRGATDGFFVAALEEGSLHLWDLSEEPIWRDDVTNVEKSAILVEPNSKELLDVERDREWNIKNSQVGLHQNLVQCALQSCAYTSSALHIRNNDAVDSIVGLELTGDARTVTQDGGRKIIGQIVSLQRIGILTIWTIVQEKSKEIMHDIGKAFSSKIKLERSQTIRLLDYIDGSYITEPKKYLQTPNFSLNSAKRRLLSRKQEKSILKKGDSRPKSAISVDFAFGIDRPASAASARSKVLPVEKNDLEKWDNGVVCYDLKIMYWNNDINYLVAKNCGEVLCCKKYLGAIKVERICVASDMSAVTRLEISPHCLPYFLAACDVTINLCSLLDTRVLLTLDCRNIPTQDVERCQSDHKGRYISSVASKHGAARTGTNMSVTSVSWSRVNPCCILATLQDGAAVGWQLTHSDIYAKYACESAAIACAAADNTLALLTPEGEVQVHRLTNEQRTNEYLQVFEKYIALL